jgi:putative Holliday junction resolvase
MLKQGYCLGFDFGLKKIGYAIGQFITCTAQPMGFILAKDGIPNWQEIAHLIKEWQPKCLIVGLPTAVDGKNLSVTPKVLVFAKSLEQYQLPVYFTDERMTSKEARSHLFEQGGYRALSYGKIDSIAAALLLEQWMHQKE